MPIPKKLERKATEVLGGEATEAMAEWIDKTETDISAVRQDIRADFAEFRHEMDVRFERVDARFTALEAKVDTMNATLTAKIDTEIAGLTAKIDTEIAGLTAKIDTGIAGLTAKIDTGIAGLDAKLARQGFDVMKWAFGFWIASLAMLLGGLAAFLRLSR